MEEEERKDTYLQAFGHLHFYSAELSERCGENWEVAEIVLGCQRDLLTNKYLMCKSLREQGILPRDSEETYGELDAALRGEDPFAEYESEGHKGGLALEMPELPDGHKYMDLLHQWAMERIPEAFHSLAIFAADDPSMYEQQVVPAAKELLPQWEGVPSMAVLEGLALCQWRKAGSLDGELEAAIRGQLVPGKGVESATIYLLGEGSPASLPVLNECYDNFRWLEQVRTLAAVHNLDPQHDHEATQAVYRRADTTHAAINHVMEMAQSDYRFGLLPDGWEKPRLM